MIRSLNKLKHVHQVHKKASLLIALGEFFESIRSEFLVLFDVYLDTIT